ADFRELGTRPSKFSRRRRVTLSLDDLWKWSTANGQDPPWEESDELYWMSWATVHYLVDHRSRELQAFETALGAGQNPKVAWHRLFPDLDGVTFREAISEFIQEYEQRNGVSGGTHPGLNMLKEEVARARARSAVQPHSHSPPRTLSSADIVALRAWLYVARAGQTQRSEDDDQERATSSLAE